MRLFLNSVGSVIRSQSNLPWEMTSTLPSRLVKLRDGLESRIKTLFVGMPHCLAASVARSLNSELQTSNRLVPMVICRASSATVDEGLAAEYTPPAAMIPKKAAGIMG